MDNMNLENQIVPPEPIEPMKKNRKWFVLMGLLVLCAILCGVYFLYVNKEVSNRLGVQGKVDKTDIQNFLNQNNYQAVIYQKYYEPNNYSLELLRSSGEKIVLVENESVGTHYDSIFQSGEYNNLPDVMKWPGPHYAGISLDKKVVYYGESKNAIELAKYNVKFPQSTIPSKEDWNFMETCNFQGVSPNNDYIAIEDAAGLYVYRVNKNLLQGKDPLNLAEDLIYKEKQNITTGSIFTPVVAKAFSDRVCNLVWSRDAQYFYFDHYGEQYETPYNYEGMTIKSGVAKLYKFDTVTQKQIVLFDENQWGKEVLKRFPVDISMDGSLIVDQSDGVYVWSVNNTAEIKKIKLLPEGIRVLGFIPAVK